MTTKQHVVLIDGYNFLYRAFHGNKQDLKNDDGFPTGALYIALSMINKIRSSSIDYALVVFDGSKNFREEIDAEYKANRKPMPDDLKLQLPKLKEALEYMGWPLYTADGVEADDVIGSLAVRASKANFDVDIYSGDKDFRAIVDDNIKIIDTLTKTTYNRAKVFEKMGVYPEQVHLYLTLMGDSSDNVKGVDKCGKKTAAEWCNEYKTLENLIQHKDEIKNKVGENLRMAISDGTLEKDFKLTELKLDVNIELSKRFLSFKDPDKEKIKEFALLYNFKSWLNDEVQYQNKLKI